MVDSRAYAFEGTEPEIHADAHVSREATLVGDVTVDADASVWLGVVLRGDVAPVRIGRVARVGDPARGDHDRPRRGVRGVPLRRVHEPRGAPRGPVRVSGRRSRWGT